MSQEKKAVFNSKGQVIDLSQDEKALAQLLWRDGLKSAADYVQLKTQLPFQHFAIQVAYDLNDANLLYKGTDLDFDLFHTGDWQAKADYQTLIQSNHVLMKVISEENWADFLKQIADFSYRPKLRAPKSATATHKFDAKSGQIIEYKGKRKIKDPLAYDKTKKQSASLLSRNLHTPVFGEQHGNKNLVGLLFDETKCDIRAMFKYDRGTYPRGWVGSKAEVEQYLAQMQREGNIYTDRAAFENYVNTSKNLNEVLAKFSKASILGIFIARDTPETRRDARQRHAKLKKTYQIDYPIFFYDNKNNTIRIYSKHEQESDALGVHGLSEFSPLMIAIYTGDLELFNTLLSKGGDVHYSDYLDKKKVLMYAAEKGYLEMVTALLSKGADANDIYSYGYTALMDAAEKRYLGTITTRLVNSYDEWNRKTVLMYAVEKGNLDIVNVLLSKGADVNANDSDGKTVLMYAVQNGHLDMVNILLSKGADVSAEDSDGKTVLMWAVQNGHLDMVNILLSKGANVIMNASGSYRWTALINAARKGHMDIVNAVMDKMAGVIQSAPNCVATMIYECQYNFEQLLSKLDERLNVSDEIKQILVDTDFNTQFTIIIKKWLAMEEMAKYNPKKYRSGADAAKTLVMELGKAKVILSQPGSLQDKKAEFVKSCIAAITEASNELDKYRDWKKPLARALLAFVTFGLSTVLPSLGLFSHKTDFAKKLGTLETALKKSVEVKNQDELRKGLQEIKNSQSGVSDGAAPVNFKKG